jgi:nucleotide-binding universal stress UspA family protein
VAYRHILIATGGAEHSLRAEARAAELAKALGARLTVLSVMRLAGTAEGMVAGLPMEAGSISAQVYEDLQARQQSILDEARARLAAQGLEVAARLESGSAGRAIVDVAKELNCDLIVVGRRKLSAVGALALGSVSDFVNRHAHCDVLIVH